MRWLSGQIPSRDANRRLYVEYLISLRDPGANEHTDAQKWYDLALSFYACDDFETYVCSRVKTCESIRRLPARSTTGTWYCGRRVPGGNCHTGRVAIRQFQSLAEPSSAEWQAQRDHFLQGAHQAANLVHPRIVGVLDVIDENPEAYVATEYISSETLATVLSRESLTPERANYLLRGVALALDYAHQNGVTHGDVKPSDIFILPQGGAKIGDFAISPRAWPGRPTEFPQGWIHPYLAPEAITSPQTIGPWSDRYSLAAVAYHLYTGTPLFAGILPDAGPAIVRGVVPAPSIIKQQISVSIDAVLLRALSRDPQQRYRSCLEFVDALDASLAQHEQIAVVVPMQARTGNNKLLLGLGALGLVAGGAVAAALWSSHTKPLPAEVKSAPVQTADAPRIEPPSSGQIRGCRAAVRRAITIEPPARQAPTGDPVTRKRQEQTVVNTPDSSSGKRNPFPVPPVSAARTDYTAPVTRSSIAPSPVNEPAPRGVSDGARPGWESKGDPREMDLRVFSRRNEISAGFNVSMKDPTLGEMSDGDLTAAVSANGPLPKGRLSVEWWLGNVRMNMKMLTPQQLSARGGVVVDYGNEPTPGDYRVILRSETSVLKEFTFRIIP